MRLTTMAPPLSAALMASFRFSRFMRAVHSSLGLESLVLQLKFSLWTAWRHFLMKKSIGANWPSGRVYTLEISENWLSFLDVKLSVNSVYLRTSVHHKPIDSHGYLIHSSYIFRCYCFRLSVRWVVWASTPSSFKVGDTGHQKGVRSVGKLNRQSHIKGNGSKQGALIASK